MSQSPTRPFQFTLGQLLLLMAACCVLSAGVYWVGAAAVLALGLGAAIVVAIVLAGHKLGVGEAVAIAVLVMAVGALLMPAFMGARDGGGRRGQCMNNLHNIALALQQYEIRNGTLPPAYIADENGKPMHSWRVLLLPYLEQQNLYNQYRFDEPWDGPNNSKLHAVHLKIYWCPSDGYLPGQTSYVAITGLQTAWPGVTSARDADFINGLSKTILVTEIYNSGIHWMEPRDLDFSMMSMAINPKTPPGISSGHRNGRGAGANVAFVDGQVRFLENDLSPRTLRAMLTISGGEKGRKH